MPTRETGAGLSNPGFAMPNVTQESNMTGEELFNLLLKMNDRNDAPRKREKTLKKLAEKEGLRATRFARRPAAGATRTGSPTP